MLRPALRASDHSPMPHVETRAPETPSRSDPIRPPSVLVVLVVKDGEQWLRHCLVGLSAQSHPRVGVLAIDNGSTDGSRQLLESALGPDRVIGPDHNLGFAGAVAQAVQSDADKQADYALLLHDDTVLDPGAIAALVEAAERVDGVGVVGPKVVDWDEPRRLREIGRSIDRFGFPYSPLEEGEIDQGQYDRMREVLYVSSCAMLVATGVWSRIGPPDERLGPVQDDLDFCWRARLSGFRVLMTPKALARHKEASLRGERVGTSSSDRWRYYRERAALASMLKNYGLLSLLWVLPLYLLQGLVRIGLLGIARRFQDAYQVVAAWGWNLAHLPGTVRRRVRAQAVRRVPDRSMRRSMAPAGIRLRRWGQSAVEAVLPRHEEEAEQLSSWGRALRLARDHPVATAWSLAVVVGAIAYHALFRTSPLIGPGLPAFPPTATPFFRELVSGLRHTGLGGTQAASPALGLLGLGSVLTLGSPPLLAKVMLLGLPAVAGATCYRAVRSMVQEMLPAVVAGACYGLSSLVLWGVSEGRIPALVFVAGTPWLATKLFLPFDAEFRVPAARWVVGAGLGLAVLGSFYPGALLASAVLVAAALLTPLPDVRRARGMILFGAALASGALLVFPLALDIVHGGGRALTDMAGRPDFGSLARVSLGTGPGSWPTGFFLPVAAALALVFVSRRSARTAIRAGLAAILAVYVAWFAAAGYLPPPLSNPVAYLTVAALGFSVLVGVGMADLSRQVSRMSFGHRQVGMAALAVVLAVGLAGQALQAMRGAWAVGGPDRIPAAYAAVQAPPGRYRVLWLGRTGGDAFPPPAGLPEGQVAAGAASVRYAVRPMGGASALDTGRPAAGRGYAALEDALEDILSGPTRHGGALLAPFSIRFVVARPADLPVGAARRLSRQLDLDPVPAEGLTIFENAKAPPVASVVPDADWRLAASRRGPGGTEGLTQPHPTPLLPSGQASFAGPPTTVRSLSLLSEQYDGHWRMQGKDGQTMLPPTRAFGWAVGFVSQAQATGFAIRFHGQTVRTVEMWLLAFLWAAALWATRRPTRSG